MAIKLGKIKTEVICPLCKSIWLLDEGEWSIVPESEHKATFHCHDCNKDIIFDVNDIVYVRTYNKATEYKDIILYEDYEEKD